MVSVAPPPEGSKCEFTHPGGMTAGMCADRLERCSSAAIPLGWISPSRGLPVVALRLPPANCFDPFGMGETGGLSEERNGKRMNTQVVFHRPTPAPPPQTNRRRSCAGGYVVGRLVWGEGENHGISMVTMGRLFLDLCRTPQSARLTRERDSLLHARRVWTRAIAKPISAAGSTANAQRLNVP